MPDSSLRPRPCAFSTLLLAVVWAVGGLFASPAVADVLVTVDGERIETRGPWEIRGRQVVFETPQGFLSSLRLSSVDLEASEAASRPASGERRRDERPEEEPPPWLSLVKPADDPTEPEIRVTNRSLERGPPTMIERVGQAVAIRIVGSSVLRNRQSSSEPWTNPEIETKIGLARRGFDQAIAIARAFPELQHLPVHSADLARQLHVYERFVTELEHRASLGDLPESSRRVVSELADVFDQVVLTAGERPERALERLRELDATGNVELW